MVKTKLDPAQIRIADFKIIKGEISSPFEFDIENVDGFQCDVSYDMGLNLKDKMVKSDFRVDICSKTTEGEQEEATGSFYFVFIYSVSNLNELAHLDKKSKTTIVDGALGNALASITYSTSRGILMTRFQGTALQNFTLPVINPNDLLNK